MALTTNQRQILTRAVRVWAATQEAAGNLFWLADLCTSTAAQRKAVLQPIVQAIRDAATATQAALPAARSTQDTTLASDVNDSDTVISNL